MITRPLPEPMGFAYLQFPDELRRKVEKELKSDLSVYYALVAFSRIGHLRKADLDRQELLIIVRDLSDLYQRGLAMLTACMDGSFATVVEPPDEYADDPSRYNELAAELIDRTLQAIEDQLDPFWPDWKLLHSEDPHELQETARFVRGRAEELNQETPEEADRRGQRPLFRGSLAEFVALGELLCEAGYLVTAKNTRNQNYKAVMANGFRWFKSDQSISSFNKDSLRQVEQSPGYKASARKLLRKLERALENIADDSEE